MKEPTNEQKAQILRIWKSAYENLVENMRERSMWSISIQNLELLVSEMDKKAKDLDDSES